MATYIKVDGTWQAVSGDTSSICGYAKVDGAWKTVTNTYVKVSGSWKPVCEPLATPTPTPSVGGGGGTPAQDSSVSNLSPSSGAAAGGYTVTLNGSFPSDLTNISVAGTNVGSFSRVSSTAYSFTMPAGTQGTTAQIQAFNGRTPLMSELTFTYNSTGGGGTTCTNGNYCNSITYGDGTNVTIGATNGTFTGSLQTESCGTNGTRTKAYTCVTPGSCPNIPVAAGTCNEVAPVDPCYVAGYGTGGSLPGYHLCTDADRLSPYSCSPCTSTGACINNGASGASCSPPVTCTCSSSTSSGSRTVPTYTCSSGTMLTSTTTYSGCPTCPSASTSDTGCYTPPAPVTCNGAWTTYATGSASCCNGTKLGSQTESYQYRICTDGSLEYRISTGTCTGGSNDASCGYVAGCQCGAYTTCYGTSLCDPVGCCAGTNCCCTLNSPSCTTTPAPSVGGGGCIVGSTLISTPLGYVKAEDLKVGDPVHSIKFEELSSDETAYSLTTWSSMTMTPVEMLETSIKAIVVKKDVEAYVSLNGDLFSPEHRILVEWENKYFFAEAGGILVGYKVLTRTGNSLDGLKWVMITTNDVVFEEATVYLFDTEDEDVLFTKGMLTHNFKL